MTSPLWRRSRRLLALRLGGLLFPFFLGFPSFWACLAPACSWDPGLRVPPPSAWGQMLTPPSPLLPPSPIPCPPPPVRSHCNNAPQDWRDWIVARHSIASCGQGNKGSVVTAEDLESALLCSLVMNVASLALATPPLPSLPPSPPPPPYRRCLKTCSLSHSNTTSTSALYRP